MNIQELIDSKLEQQPEQPRPHIGCSTLGHACDRYLWLSFHWAVAPSYPGRLLRLFKRGQDEESSVIKYLTMIGARVLSQQKMVDFSGHVSGSIDGVMTGLPGHELDHVLLEIKTHNRKSFNELEKKGVQAAKPVHYIQMQCYMHGLKLTKALYYAVCKDDDRIHSEIVLYDQHEALAAIERGQAIALSQRMPEPMSANPDYYVCKMCAMHEFCHKTQFTKKVNCRTCRHAIAKNDSTWRCSIFNDNPIPYHYQLTGCDSHVLHPDLVPYPGTWNDDTSTATFIVDGKRVRNGHPAPDVYSSQEIIADAALCASGDSFVEALRSGLSARIVAHDAT